MRLNCDWPKPKEAIFTIEWPPELQRYFKMRSLIPDLERLIEETKL